MPSTCDHKASYRSLSSIARLEAPDLQQLHESSELFGLDECLLDVSGSVHLFGNVTVIAKEIWECMKHELGITISVGVSYNKGMQNSDLT